MISPFALHQWRAEALERDADWVLRNADRRILVEDNRFA
jgi:hypothetical protein